MTTRGVRAFVEGIQSKLSLDPRTLTKVQTGGPDGDLGSNEIKLSNEGKTLAVVDGSGVLCDPDGLDQCVQRARPRCAICQQKDAHHLLLLPRAELVRLATGRKMARHFATRLLGPRGFFLPVDATDAVLPSGVVVVSRGLHASAC
jgi:glutamate dehydrogenase